MPKLRPQLWTNEKGQRFVVLPEADFVRLAELAEDRGLSRILRAAVASDAGEASVPFDQVRRQLAPRRRPSTGKKIA
ncbi:MAG TPA: hypothetical protein VK324_14875 [Tepidisphaeraceae bacterium]|nr:hypothetical protein [Tepidisphaeraceae bacterium]